MQNKTQEKMVLGIIVLYSIVKMNWIGFLQMPTYIEIPNTSKVE